MQGEEKVRGTNTHSHNHEFMVSIRGHKHLKFNFMINNFISSTPVYC